MFHCETQNMFILIPTTSHTNQLKFNFIKRKKCYHNYKNLRILMITLKYII